MKVYVKSSCVSCRRTLTEMERLKIDVEERDIFKDRLSESEIKKIVKLAKITPREMLRKRDKMYKELGLEDAKYTDSQLVELMAEHPGLIGRPIIFGKNRVTVGKTGAKDLKSL